MAQGTVKWFNEARGLGLIVPDDRSEVVYVHFATIEGTGHRELTKGQRVTFEAEPGPRGPRTTRVRPVPWVTANPLIVPAGRSVISGK